MSHLNELPLRYGVNPHQKRARATACRGELPLRLLNGSLSAINLLDALNSWQLVQELARAVGLPAAASFKHVSPAGAAVGTPLNDELAKAYAVDDLELSPLATAYARARGADRLSSFGDWVSLSEPCDLSTAQLLRREVSDGILAPGFSKEALQILKEKKKGAYPILEIDPDYTPPPLERREIFGIQLEQERNQATFTEEIFQNAVTSNKKLPKEALRDLLVACIALKYTQSNSVSVACDGQLIGVGAGQQSRIHCTRLACSKADLWHLRRHPEVLKLQFRAGIARPERDNAIDLYLREELTAVEEKAWVRSFAQVPQRLSRQAKKEWLSTLSDIALASDAFFPFRDSIDRAAQSGVSFIAQPGGSRRDREVMDACNEYGMVMVFTGIRLFHH